MVTTGRFGHATFVSLEPSIDRLESTPGDIEVALKAIDRDSGVPADQPFEASIEVDDLGEEGLGEFVREVSADQSLGELGEPDQLPQIKFAFVRASIGTGAGAGAGVSVGLGIRVGGTGLDAG